MKAIIHTSSDYFQHYIPLFAYCFHRLYPSVEIHATIYGGTTAMTAILTSDMPYLFLHEELRPVPPAVGRFLQVPDGDVIIADADILFMEPGLIEYCQRMAKDSCYYAAHGAWKKPKRFPESWYGKYERLCGAFVYVTQEWTDRTKVWREQTIELFCKGKLQEYREEDEVILCNICKMAGFPINQDKYYPLQHRGLHLGDFKPEMQHRFTDHAKMKKYLHPAVRSKFLEMHLSDFQWKELVRGVRGDEKINEVFINLFRYLGI